MATSLPTPCTPSAQPWPIPRPVSHFPAVSFSVILPRYTCAYTRPPAAAIGSCEPPCSTQPRAGAPTLRLKPLSAPPARRANNQPKLSKTATSPCKPRRCSPETQKMPPQHQCLVKNLQKIREKEQKFSEKSLTLASSICIIGGTPTRGGPKGQARAERRKSRGKLPEPAGRGNFQQRLSAMPRMFAAR